MKEWSIRNLFNKDLIEGCLDKGIETCLSSAEHALLAANFRKKKATYFVVYHTFEALVK